MNSQDIKKTVGNRVKYYRKRNKLTQTELAEKVGSLSKSYITNIETGVKGLSFERMIALCAVLQVTPADLLPVTVQKETDTCAVKEETIAEVTELLNQLNTAQVTMLKAMLDAAVTHLNATGL